MSPLCRSQRRNMAGWEVPSSANTSATCCCRKGSAHTTCHSAAAMRSAAGVTCRQSRKCWNSLARAPSPTSSWWVSHFVLQLNHCTATSVYATGFYGSQVMCSAVTIFCHRRAAAEGQQQASLWETSSVGSGRVCMPMECVMMRSISTISSMEYLPIWAPHLMI